MHRRGRRRRPPWQPLPARDRCHRSRRLRRASRHRGRIHAVRAARAAASQVQHRARCCHRPLCTAAGGREGGRVRVECGREKCGRERECGRGGLGLCTPLSNQVYSSFYWAGPLTETDLYKVPPSENRSINRGGYVDIDRHC